MVGCIVVTDSLKLLLHGIDTVQCAYYLTPPRAKYLDFIKLAVIKEQLRMDKSREPRAVTLGGTDFFLHPMGVARAIRSCSPTRISRLNWGNSTIPRFM